MSVRMKTWVMGLVAALFMVGGAAASPSFVGAGQCVSCHEEQASLWKGSHHDLAMKPAREPFVLGDFSDVSLEHFGTVSRFYKKDGEFYVETEGPKGKSQSFHIAYTFGVYPLQQYLVAFPGGRYQALSIAWDSRPAPEGGQKWFHLYPDQHIDSSDALHWTGSYLNWNSRCADCHSTNLKKGYESDQNRYQTTWSDINVACESCHGPGSEHVKWVSGPLESGEKNSGFPWTLDTGASWASTQWMSTAESGKRVNDVTGQVAVCGSCHSRRAALEENPVSDRYYETHELELLRDPLYHPDGQIKDEVYVLGSFLQSKMYRKGVVCSNCHEPHSLKLRAEGNQVCAQCHNPKVFNTAEHHHHKAGAGAQCVNCHMPETVYMQVDGRRDHSFRVPRPGLSERTGSPNACVGCHEGKTNGWAESAMQAWAKQGDHAANTGDRQTLEFHYGDAFYAAFEEKPDAFELLQKVLEDNETSAFVKASALEYMVSIDPEASFQLATPLMKSGDPLLRKTAVRTFASAPSRLVRQYLLPMLDDPVKGVRLEVARVLTQLSAVKLNLDEMAAWGQVFEEYNESLDVVADTPEGQLNIGNHYLVQKQLDAAEKAYKRALKLDPAHLGARLNLADLQRELGRESEALENLRLAVQQHPGQGMARYALGLAEVRRQEYRQAETHFIKAVELEPGNARFVYVLAVLKQSLGKEQAAQAMLERFYRAGGRDVNALWLMLDIARRQRNWEAVRQYALDLKALQPGNPRVQRILSELRSNSH